MLRLELPAGPLSILCLGAHSDDIEIGCGGTLMRLCEERPGSRVHFAVFSCEGVRAEEAHASAASFLASAGERRVITHRFRESYFPYVAAQIKDACEGLAREVSPQLLFTHRREDLHQDHRLLAELSWNTFRDHLILEYEIPKYEGDLGPASLYVPLSEAMARRKVDLLLRHFKSQAGRRWFRPETFEAILRLRGIECNAAEGLAEAFTARKMTI